MQAPIRPDGSFSFSNVPQGTALLSVDGSIEDLVGRQIVVGDRDVTGLEFTLRELPEMFDLTGRFIVDGSEVIPAELSRLQLRAQRPRTGGPNSMPQGGVIAMQLSPGDYELSVQGLPQNYEVVSISYGDLDLRTASLKVDAPLTKEVVVRIGTFPPRGAFAKVSGRVTNLPAAPYIQNPKIILRRDLKAGGGTLETRVAADGTFAFPGAPPGRYTLTTSGLTADFQRSLEVKDADIADVTVALAGLSVPPSSEALVGMNLFGDIDITLRGVISEVVTQRRSGPPSPAYVRMEIPDAAGELKSWMVMFSLPRPAAGEPAPDTTKLKRGTHVIVVGTPAIDGSNRLFLTPRSGPTTVLGIEIVPD
jgi:hypothetical protein